MQPLEAFRDQLVTVSKMKAPWGESVHLGASSAFLNGVGPVGAKGAGGDAFGKIESKKTVDQHIADAIAEDTPLRSIEVGTEDMGTAVGACDGFPCTFFNALSWRDDVSPLPIGINPRVTFERMFGDGSVLIDGLTLIETVNQQLQLNLSDPHYDTIAGYFLGKLGHIPRLSEEIEAGGVKLQVEAMDGLRISQLKLHRID